METKHKHIATYYKGDEITSFKVQIRAKGQAIFEMFRVKDFDNSPEKALSAALKFREKTLKRKLPKDSVKIPDGVPTFDLLFDGVSMGFFSAKMASINQNAPHMAIVTLAQLTQNIMTTECYDEALTATVSNLLTHSFSIKEQSKNDVPYIAILGRGFVWNCWFQKDVQLENNSLPGQWIPWDTLFKQWLNS